MRREGEKAKVARLEERCGMRCLSREMAYLEAISGFLNE